MGRFLIYNAEGRNIGSCDHEAGVAYVGNVEYRKAGLVGRAFMGLNNEFVQVADHDLQRGMFERERLGHWGGGS